MDRRRIAFVALAVAAAFALAAPAGAENQGVGVGSGDLVKGDIALASDTDTFVADLAEGALLSGSVKAQKGSALLPGISLLRPNGSAVGLGTALKGLGKTKVSFKNFVADATGDWGMVVVGTSGTTGLYDASFKWKSPAKGGAKGTTVPNNGSHLCGLVGDDGALFTFKVTEKSGPALAAVEVVGPDGEIVAGSEALVVRKGTKISGKKIPLAGGFGTYGVRLVSAGAGVTVVDCTVSVKFAKHTKETIELGPEPSLTSTSPNQGKDGTNLTVDGANFVSGARVFFDDVEATPVAFQSATALGAAAPVHPSAASGGQVDITVVNPDGQSVTLANGYRYLGPPLPTSVTPSGSPLTGGVTLQISGNNFRAGSTVTVGGNPATNVQVVATNLITCVTPAGVAGPAPVVVTDEFGRAALPVAGHSYFGPPTITSVSPTSGPSYGGTTVTVSGSAFRSSPATRLFVDSVEYVGHNILSGSSLSFVLPAGESGPVTLSVQDEFGQSSTNGSLLSRTRALQVVADAIPDVGSGLDFFALRMELGDLDGDGAPDIVLSSPYAYYDYYSSSNIGSRILMNNGDGTFTDGTAARNGSFQYNGDYGQGTALALHDINGDSYLDIVLSSHYPFYDYSKYTTYNGKPAYYWGGATDFATRLLLNDGNGYFTRDGGYRLPTPGSSAGYGTGERFQAIANAMGDLDGDETPDLILLHHRQVDYAYIYGAYYNPKAGTYYLYESAVYTPALRVLTNDGSGYFTHKTDAIPGPYMNYGNYVYEDFDGVTLEVGDLDGNGSNDIVVTRAYPFSYYNWYSYQTYYYDATRVLLNDGYASFSWNRYAMPTSPGQGGSSPDFWQASCSALGDLDGNGTNDLVLGLTYAQYYYDAVTGGVVLSPAIRLFTNDGYGYFYNATDSAFSSSLIRSGGSNMLLGVNEIHLGDVDGDGSTDIVTAGSVYYVYNYNGSGTGYYGQIPSGYVNPTKILLNDGYGFFTDATTDMLPPAVNGDWFQSKDLDVRDLDDDGSLDFIFVSNYYPNTPYQTTENNRPLRVLLNK
jgi:hypothetical protein